MNTLDVSAVCAMHASVLPPANQRRRFFYYSRSPDIDDGVIRVTAYFRWGYGPPGKPINQENWLVSAKKTLYI